MRSAFQPDEHIRASPCRAFVVSSPAGGWDGLSLWPNHLADEARDPGSRRRMFRRSACLRGIRGSRERVHWNPAATEGIDRTGAQGVLRIRLPSFYGRGRTRWVYPAGGSGLFCWRWSLEGRWSVPRPGLPSSTERCASTALAGDLRCGLHGVAVAPGRGPAGPAVPANAGPGRLARGLRPWSCRHTFIPRPPMDVCTRCHSGEQHAGLLSQKLANLARTGGLRPAREAHPSHSSASTGHARLSEPVLGRG